MPSPLHHSAHGFERAAGAYERARPGFPAGAIAHLGTRLGLGPAANVIDIGAGTGKLSTVLADTGSAVTV